MSANLDMSRRGRAAFAFCGEVAWHRQGTEVPEGASKETWLESASLDFHVSKRPLVFAKSDGTFGDTTRFALVRDDTEAALGVASDRYQPVQPSDCYDMWQRYLEVDPRFRMETMGALRGGAVVWALARFERDIVAGGDKHRAYLHCTTSFDGSIPTIAQATVTRVVCENTSRCALSDTSALVRVTHSTRWTDAVRDRVHAQIETQAAQFDRYASMADAMAQNRIAEAETRKIFETLVYGHYPLTKDDEKSSRAANQVAALEKALVAPSGADPRTAWGVFNAVTNYVDHTRSTRVTAASAGDSTEQARLYSAMYGPGAAMKRDVVAMLAESCGVDFGGMLQAA